MGSVEVCVKLRPLIKKEQKAVVFANGNEICFSKDNRVFSFNNVYGPDSDGSEAYNRQVFPLVREFTKGFNCSIFAFGQTGSGKTRLLVGEKNKSGYIYRIADQLYNHIQSEGGMDVGEDFLIMATFLEIYNEKVFDLCGSNPKDRDKPLMIREDKLGRFHVPEATSHVVRTKEELIKFMEEAEKTRSACKHSRSSRSHFLTQIDLQRSVVLNSTVSPEVRKVYNSTLMLADLAGNERVLHNKQTPTKEGRHINQSISCLTEVISQLSTASRNDGAVDMHIPYRRSKLTKLLKPALGGNSKTLMLVCISPASYHESLTTLRHAVRFRRIQNAPKINRDEERDTIMSLIYGEINKLKTAIDNPDARKYAKLKKLPPGSPRSVHAPKIAFRGIPISFGKKYGYDEGKTEKELKNHLEELQNCIVGDWGGNSQDEPEEELFLSPDSQAVAKELIRRRKDFKTLYFKQTRQNEHLRTLKESLETKCDKLEEDNRKLSKRDHAMQTKFEKYKDESKQVKTEKEVQLRVIKSHSEKIVEQQLKINQLNGKSKELTKKYDTQEEKLNQEISKQKEVEKRLRLTAQRQSTHAEQITKSMSSKCLNASGKLKQYKQKARALDKIRSELDLENKQLVSDVKRYEDDFVILKKDLDCLNREKTKLECICEDLQQTGREQSSLILELQMSKKQLQEDFVIRQTYIRDLERQIDDSKEVSANSTKQMAKTFDGFQDRLQDTLQALEANTKLLSQKETELAARDLEIQEFRSRTEIVTIKLERESILNHDLMQDNDNLHRKLQEANNRLLQEDQTKDFAEQQITRQKEMLEKAQQKIRVLKNNDAIREAEIENLRSHSKKIEAQFQRKQEELAKAVVHCKKLSKNLQAKKGSLAKFLKARIEDLQAEEEAEPES